MGSETVTLTSIYDLIKHIRSADSNTKKYTKYKQSDVKPMKSAGNNTASAWFCCCRDHAMDISDDLIIFDPNDPGNSNLNKQLAFSDIDSGSLGVAASPRRQVRPPATDDSDDSGLDEDEDEYSETCSSVIIEGL